MVPRRDSGEDGSAVLEFVVLAVVLLIPTIYLVLTVGRLQAAAYATSTAARSAARAYVTAPPGSSPQARADAAAGLAFGDHGFDGGHITVRCAAQPCLTPEARVDVTAEVDVPLPLVPDLIADRLPATVRVSAVEGYTVDRFRDPGS
ncbi:MAG: pilus assembly protein [Austwickia sp.]|nr:pilus assembly protein [Actinomycetota bacterium]MCB1254400.1 pilus assembly protein [Austwickia sp.]